MVYDNDSAFTGTNRNNMGYASTFAGALSLFRRPYSKSVTDSDLIVSGVPYDLAVTNRPGTRFGPRSIRAASAHMSWEGSTWPWKFDPFKVLTVTDYGDCDIDHGFPEKIPAQIKNHAQLLLSGNAKILTMGGDHFLTYPILEAVCEKYGPISLVHIDAHLDTWPEAEERIDHGTMFYHAARKGYVIPERSIQIGMRTWAEDNQGFNVFDAKYVHEQGVKAVVEQAISIVGDNLAYLSFDIDALDPSVAPGTGTPVCGGLSMWQAQSIIRGLRNIYFIGMDVVEVAPAYDVGEITSLAGSHLMLDFICLLASKEHV